MSRKKLNEAIKKNKEEPEVEEPEQTDEEKLEILKQKIAETQRKIKVEKDKEEPKEEPKMTFNPFHDNGLFRIELLSRLDQLIKILGGEDESVGSNETKK